MTIQQILFGIAISAIAGFAGRSLIGRAAQLVRVTRQTRRQ